MTINETTATLIIHTVPMVADYLLPPLIGIAQTYPQLSLTYAASMSQAPLTPGSMALHICAGPRPKVVDAEVRYIGRVQFCLFGASSYLSQRGIPQTAEDLDRFEFIVQDKYINMTPWERWLSRVAPNARIGMRSDCDIAHRLAVSLGQGLGFLPMSALLYYTDLVEVMPALEEWTAPMWLLVDSLSYQDPMIADIADQLHQRLAELWP